MPRGRPPGSKNKPKQPQAIGKPQRIIRDNKPRKICAACQKSLLLSKFYRSKNDQLHADGFLPYCKECLVEMSLDPETHIVNAEKLQNLLRQCDRPWDKTVLDAARSECENNYNPEIGIHELNKAIIKLVWKNIQSLPQYDMSWQEYEDKKKVQANSDNIGAAQNYAKNLREGILPEYKEPDEDDKPIFPESMDDDFEVTDEIFHRWGVGYSKKEYKAFEDKYKFLSQSYANYSSLHQEALLNYCRFKVKEEIATSVGDVDAASSWSTLATKAATNAKINPSQITEETDGGFSFSEFNAAIERASDVIRILPQFKAEAQDAVDFCIYVYVNYIASMLGKPPIEYEDVYKFYDDAVESYKAQYGDVYGIFKEKNNPTKKNRKAVEKFIDVPKDSQASYYSGDD